MESALISSSLLVVSLHVIPFFSAVSIKVFLAAIFIRPNNGLAISAFTISLTIPPEAHLGFSTAVIEEESGLTLRNIFDGIVLKAFNLVAGKLINANPDNQMEVDTHKQS